MTTTPNSAIERAARAIFDEARSSAIEVGEHTAQSAPDFEAVEDGERDFMRRLARASFAALSATNDAVLREALERIAAFDDGEHMADDVWDEIMDTARAALSTNPITGGTDDAD